MSKDQGHQARGLAIAACGGLAVVGLAVTAALVGASGPVAAQVRENESARQASASARHAEPPFATRAEARRVGRRLLGLVVTPPGTRQVSSGQVPGALRHPAQTMNATAYLDVSEFSAAPRPMHQVLAFLSHHRPEGTTLTGSGTTGGGAYLVHEVDYSPRHLPAAFTEIDILVQVFPCPHGQTWVRTDVQLVWYPRRSAAEYLTGDHFTSVTINASIYGRRYRDERRTFRQQAIIDKLTRALNSAPASPGGMVFCPAFMEIYTLTFTPVQGQAGVSVSAPGCAQYVVKIGGRDQGALADTGQVEEIAHALTKPNG